MKKTPLLEVKEKFGGKEKLVDDLVNKLKRPSEVSKDELKKKLMAQSNKKLLKLLQRENVITEKFGGRDKLISTILQTGSNSNKKEDKLYRKKLESAASSHLLDLQNRLSS